jgi:hypothetical protein
LQKSWSSVIHVLCIGFAIPRRTDERQTSVLNRADKTDDIVDQEAILENRFFCNDFLRYPKRPSINENLRIDHASKERAQQYR